MLSCCRSVLVVGSRRVFGTAQHWRALFCEVMARMLMTGEDLRRDILSLRGPTPSAQYTLSLIPHLLSVRSRLCTTQRANTIEEHVSKRKASVDVLQKRAVHNSQR